MDQQEVYPPGQAADQLGISGAGLRRLAGLYEEIYGPLPRDSRDSRLWPAEAVERLERARALVRSGRVGNIKAALRLPDEEVPDLYPLAPRPSQADFAALVEELRGLRVAVERQNALLEEQGRRLAALEALPEPQEWPETAAAGEGKGTAAQETEKPTSRPWWRRVFGNGR